LQSGADRAVAAVETAIPASASGVAIVVSDQKKDPTVLERAQEAGVPMIAVDDDILLKGFCCLSQS
jgi:L-arabinose transport system substrate-binding protein